MMCDKEAARQKNFGKHCCRRIICFQLLYCDKLNDSLWDHNGETRLPTRGQSVAKILKGALNTSVPMHINQSFLVINYRKQRKPWSSNINNALSYVIMPLRTWQTLLTVFKVDPCSFRFTEQGVHIRFIHSTWLDITEVCVCLLSKLQAPFTLATGHTWKLHVKGAFQDLVFAAKLTRMRRKATFAQKVYKTK